jgi:signal transduction histidine kinase
MQSLINDLLAYSRADTEKRVFEVIDLKNVIDEVENDLGEELAKKQGKVVPFQFRQLIYNLLSNSIKYSKLDVPPVIKIMGEVIDGLDSNDKLLIAGKSYTKITITDNGIGFDKQFSEKIFEVFQRLHSKQEYAGTGVGLAIVKKIVQNHNGFISANGESGKGAVFQIIIPSSQLGTS